MKIYSTEGKITEKNLKDMIKGKKSTLKNVGNTAILHFKKLKDYNKHIKNMALGKGNRVHTEMFHDITDHEGGSLFGKIFHSIKHIAPKVLKQVGKVALPIVVNGVSGYNPMAGAVLSGLTQQPQQIQNDEQQTYQGTGFFDTLKGVAMTQGKKLAKQALNKGIQYGSQQLEKKINGSGLIDDENNGYGLGGNRLMNSPFIQSQDIHAKMAHLRSLRKQVKKGGSMIAL